MSYEYYENIKDIDFITGSEKFVDIPLLTLVGSKDKATPAFHQKMLFDRWGCSNKIYHEVKNCGHIFRTPEQLLELKEVFSNWINSVEN